MKTIFSIILLLSSLTYSGIALSQEKCVCPDCNGEGMVDEPFARPCNFCTGGYNTCNTCHGDGQEACYRCNETGTADITCRACNGAGKINEDTCGTCGGDGLEGISCINCSGKGWNHCHSCNGEGRFICNMCGGAGEKVWRNACQRCSGTGQVDCED